MNDLPLRRLSNLVKFQFRIAKKRDLEMRITAQNGSLVITLTPAKTTKSTTATTDIPRVRRE
jgi:hypothetical protein